MLTPLPDGAWRVHRPPGPDLVICDLRNSATGCRFDVTDTARQQDYETATGGHGRNVDFTSGAIDQYRLHADVCRVLTDPKRLMLLDVLRSGERTVGELAEAIGVALPNASQHLAVLRSAGLVESRRVGTTVVYHLSEPAITDACDVIHGIVLRRLARTSAPAAGRADDAALHAIQG
jgi:DNA-binding transcriptional ArsR family regulator